MKNYFENEGERSGITMHVRAIDLTSHNVSFT